MYPSIYLTSKKHNLVGLKINNMWFLGILKLLSNSLIKPEREACGVKSGKSRCVSNNDNNNNNNNNNKSWF